MQLKDYHEKLRPFVFHGVEINNDEKEARGDCPFCDKPNHFFIKTSTGQWQCKKCSLSGNIYSFLQILLDESRTHTTHDQINSLAAERELSPLALQNFHVCVSRITNEWLIPTYNEKGSITNLYKYACFTEAGDGEEVTYYKLLGTPTCNIGLFGMHQLSGDGADCKHIKLCEGPWDAMALWYSLGITVPRGDSYKVVKQFTPPKEAVLAVPGASNFQEAWLSVFYKRKVDIMFDNDHPKLDSKGEVRLVKGKPIRPGWDGQQRLIELIKTSRKPPVKVRQLMWSVEHSSPSPDSRSKNQVGDGGHNPELPDGYDVRDLIKEEGPIKALEFLEKNLHKVKKGEKAQEFNSTQLVVVDPIERTSFQQLCEDFEGVLHFSNNLRDTLCVMLAVIVSTDLRGDQLWFRIIGPPGSGKTTLAEAVSAAREYCMPKSILTGFHSGYTNNGNSKKDSSLIPEMRGRCVVIKDADTIIQAPNKDKIMSELRDIYDGTSRAHYRNEKQNEYEDIRTTFLLCGTDELRTLNRSMLGERFLDCEIMSRGQDDKPFLERALTNTYQKVASSFFDQDESQNPDDVKPDTALFLQQVTYGFIQHLKQGLKTRRSAPTLTPEAEQSLEAMAQLLSYMRARVSRDGYDLAYRPRPELATRIVSQLVKLAVCLAIVLDKDEVDAKVISMVRKVVKDTAEGFQFDITEALASANRGPTNLTGGLNIRQLTEEVNLPETNVRRLLNDMQEFGIVERYSKNNKSGQRGRDVHIWKLTDELMSIYVGAMLLGAPLPPVVRKKETTKPPIKSQQVTHRPSRQRKRSPIPKTDS